MSVLAFPAAAAADQSAAAATYAQVAPILQAQCASCHNPQGGAPFNLLTYDDAKQWGGQILDVTQSRYMPPWLPAPDRGDFTGARRLSDADLAAIRTWVGAGMPNDATVRPAPAPAPSPDWTLGKPDLILTLTAPVALPGNGSDVFTNLVVPINSDQRHDLRAIQIRPSDPQAVRSVRIEFDQGGKLQQSDSAKQGIAGMDLPAGIADNTAGLVLWASGSQVLKPRAGESWPVQPGGDLVLGMHLKTTGRKQELQMQIGLYYAQASIKPGSALVLPLAHRGALDIPAGAANTSVEDSYKLPQAALVTAIYPRAHFLARACDAYAITPAGKQVWLLSIPKWDVDWLEVYVYRQPLLLPKGSIVHWKFVYDNSAENPHNPSDPPAAVHGGVDAKEEADGLMLELLPPPGIPTARWRKTMMPAQP